MLIRLEVLLLLVITSLITSCTSISRQDQSRNNLEVVTCLIGGGCVTITKLSLLTNIQSGYNSGYQAGYDEGRSYCSMKASQTNKDKL